MTAATAFTLLALVAGCFTGPSPAPEQPPRPSAPPLQRPRPFAIAGHWSYATRTNECNTGTGTGAVDFVSAGDGRFHEAGFVVWPDGSRISWQGEMQPSESTLQSNSLDDAVESRWFIDRERDQLVVRWKQTNGCSGIGIATRPGAPAGSFASLRWCARCQSGAGSTCERPADDGSRPLVCPALCCQ